MRQDEQKALLFTARVIRHGRSRQIRRDGGLTPREPKCCHVIDTLGKQGVFGGLLITGGVGLLVWRDPVVGAALVIVLVGVGLVAKGIASSVMEMFGLR